jgi:hypothetical protein
MNFKLQLPFTFSFFDFHKSGLINSSSAFKDLQYTKFHDSMLTLSSYGSTFEILMSTILELLKLRNQNYGAEANFNGIKGTNWFKSY